MILESICVITIYNSLKRLKEINRNSDSKQNNISNKTPLLKKTPSNHLFDGGKFKNDEYFIKLIKHMNIFESEKEVKEFMTWLKSYWKNYYESFTKWDNEQIKKYVAKCYEWRKVTLHQNFETICIPCFFRWDDGCGSFQDKQTPIPNDQSCNNLRTKLFSGETLKDTGLIYSKNGSLLGTIPFKSGDMIIPDGRWLRAGEGIDENGSTRKIKKDEFVTDNGRIVRHIKFPYLNHCWNCRAEISSIYCKPDPGYGYICNDCGCSLRERPMG
jgi:hypothetical protein